jgi:cytochrome c biogenesis protein CcmG/thiol:disulfide interchange protein DsbE
MLRRLPYLLPLLILAGLAGYFWSGLGRDPNVLPSVLIDQPLPELALPPIAGRERGLASADLKGQVSLLNIFGSWCVACQVEHPFLMQLKAEGAVPIHGINWRERDTAAGPAWLKRLGDPYTLIGADPDSRAAIALGVTGAPETFIIDAAGVIRYKHIGPITKENWEKQLWPIVERLRRG